MARDYNKVILIGRLAKDPLVSYTPSKMKVARFTVACGRQWKDKNTGEVRSQADFITCVAWTYLAEVLEKYTSKGKQLMVEGRLSVRDFDDPKTGVHKWITEVVAENIILLGTPTQGAQHQNFDTPQDEANVWAQPQQQPQSQQSGDFGSLRGEVGFDDAFPLDFAQLDGDANGSSASTGEVEIPF